MIQTGVTNRNFIRFVKAGAFGIVDEETEPMSDFKWQKLFEAAGIHKVTSIVKKGAEMHSQDRWFNYEGDMSELNTDDSEEPDIDRDIDRILRIGVKVKPKSSYLSSCFDFFKFKTYITNFL